MADFVPLQEAKEIVDISTVMADPQLPVRTYKSAEDPSNPGKEISDAEWEDYVPPTGYLKNSTRNLQFNESEFLASPGLPLGETAYIETSDGYTWAAMSNAINAMWPFDPSDYTFPASSSAYYAGNLVITPPAGVVKVTANYKAQNMKFYAFEGGVVADDPGAVPLDRYVVEDAWGNAYIMHASGQMDQALVADAFWDAELPTGWTKRVIQLEEDLILTPATGSDGSFHYLVIRDSADNSYHQFVWGEDGTSLAAQVPGMPIWGGPGDNVLRLRPDNDNLAYGGGGSDTAILPGNFSEWSLMSFAAGGAQLVLARSGYETTLYDFAFLQFDDVLIPTSAIPEPSTMVCVALALILIALAGRFRPTLRA